MFKLTPWERAGVVIGGMAVVALSAVVVVCLVSSRCWLHQRFLARNEEEEEERKKSTKKRTPKLSFTNCSREDAFYVGANLVNKGISSGHCNFKSSPVQSKDSLETQNLLGSMPPGKRDSTYSSMSEMSDRTSPTNSCRSSVGSASGSTVGSPVGGEAQGQISFSVQYLLTSSDHECGKLVLTVLELSGLSGKDYLPSHCDPYVKIIAWKEKRSIRKVKSPPLFVFRTQTKKQTSSPQFNQSFVMEVPKRELKETVLKLVVFNSDKFANATTLGEVVQPMKDVKNILVNEQRTTLNYYLAPPKQINGLTFLLTVCTRPYANGRNESPPSENSPKEVLVEKDSLSLPPVAEMPQSSLELNRKCDKYIGKVALGCHVQGDEEKQHWISVLSCPRKVVSQWHRLK